VKINQVEQLVGITKGNIRFYEKEGLLNPGRNSENGYREYSEADVVWLKKVRLLRMLDVPIEEILRRADPALVAVCLGESRRRWEGEPLAGRVGWEQPLPSLIRESRAYLEPEVERLLQAFSGELGHTSRTEQVTRCTYYIEALTEERGRLCEVLPARARTSGALCLCTALAMAILLW